MRSRDWITTIVKIKLGMMAILKMIFKSLISSGLVHQEIIVNLFWLRSQILIIKKLLLTRISDQIQLILKNLILLILRKKNEYFKLIPNLFELSKFSKKVLHYDFYIFLNIFPSKQKSLSYKLKIYIYF